MSLPNPGMSFTPFDPLTAAEANDIVENVEALADGTGLNDGAVAPDKLALGATDNTVATSQGTSSTTYTDLATTGPAVTVTVPASGKVLVTLGAEITQGGVGTGRATYAISGATTQAAADATMPSIRNGNAGSIHSGGTKLVTGLTPGSTTFTLKYRTGTSGTCTYANRYISVIPVA